MIVFNDAHTPGRQANDVGHELSHGLLHHTPTAAIDGRGCRVWDSETEEEANWLSGALLVPDEAALQIVRFGWSIPEAAAKYGVTPTDGPLSSKRHGCTEASGAPAGGIRRQPHTVSLGKVTNG